MLSIGFILDKIRLVLPFTFVFAPEWQKRKLPCSVGSVLQSNSQKVVVGAVIVNSAIETTTGTLIGVTSAQRRPQPTRDIH